MIMECEWDGCQYATKKFEPGVALDVLILHAKAKHAYNPEGEYDTDTDKGGNYNARTVQELSLDTDHYEGCWEESQPCQGEVCRYDPEGEYDTDTDNGDNYGHDMEKPSNARVARKETTDEATDVSLEHWGRGAELVGDQVTRLGGCQVGQFNCLGQVPEWDTADSVCYNHFDSCLKKRLVVWCQGEMKGYDDMRCLGEVCQFDTDTGPWSFNDGHWVQDTESNCAEVAWMQIPDEASD